MPNDFRLICLTPDGTAFEQSVEVLTVETVEGSLGVMAGHQPLLAILKNPSLVNMRLGSVYQQFELEDGILHVRKSGVTLLASRVKQLDG